MSDKQCQAILEDVINSDTLDEMRQKFIKLMSYGETVHLSVNEDAELQVELIEKSDWFKELQHEDVRETSDEQSTKIHS